MFFTLLLFIGTFILSELLKPKTGDQNAKPAGLGDFDFPTATEDRVVPLIWGTVKVTGPNVVWYGDLQQRAVTQKQKTGLFSSKTITTGYNYFIGIQFAVCRGTVNQIRRVWIGDVEVSDTILDEVDGTITINKPNLFGGNSLGNGGVTGTLRWFRGTPTQAVSTYLSAFQQEGGDTPNYKGTAHLVFEKGYVGNSSTIKPWAFELRRLPVGPGVSGAKAVNTGNDANPVYVMYEMMTNNEWGQQEFGDADIDIVAFDDAADIMVTEGNGFSFIQDTTRELSDLFEELQRQIDGVVFLDHSTGLWTIKLARNDFVFADLPILDDTNVLAVTDFTRGAWDDTVNNVTVKFSDRSRDYFSTFALGQDMANERILGRVVKSNIVFPGVKDPTLANQLAWREIRALSQPISNVTLTVNRIFWKLTPTDPIRWTNAALGIIDLVMRVTKVDLGLLESGSIKLTLTQDVYSTETPSFADPAATGWVVPSTTVVAIPAADSKIFEAPKAFSERDTDADSNGLPFRVWAAARGQSDGAIEFDIRTRLSGSFIIEREVDQFILLGELDAAISPGMIDTVLTIDPTPDSQSNILALFPDTTPTDVNGKELTRIIMVDDEFMLVPSAVTNVTKVDFQNVDRGVCDSAPASHLIGAKVFMLFVGGGIGNRSFANTNAVDVRLITRSVDDELSEASATNVVVTMDNRHLRPYPPVGVFNNGGSVYSATTIDLQLNGALDTSGISITFRRRDLDVEQENLAHNSGDFAPSNTSTVYRIRVFDTSSGDTLLFVTAYNGGNALVFVDRTTILANTSGAIPTSIRIEIETRHTITSVDYTATQACVHSFNTEDTELSGFFNFGSLADQVTSAQFTAPTTGSYGFSCGTDKTGGTVEAQVNGGGWSTIIASGTANTGTLAGVTASDTIEVRSNALTFGSRSDTILIVDTPSSSSDAYAIFTF